MKSSTAPLMLVALLFMSSLFANRFRQSFLVDQLRIPSDTAEIAGRSFHRCLEHPVISRMHVGSERDMAIRMVNSIAPQGVSKRPGEPVVMHVKAVVT